MATDTVCLLTLANCVGQGGAVSASGGTQNYLTKFTNAGGNQLGNSLLFDDGTTVGIDTNTPDNNFVLDVNGATNIGGGLTVATLSVGVVTADGTGLLSSGALDRNDSNYFNTTLSVANGGTGTNTFTANGIVYGNGTGALQVTTSGVDSILVTDGSGVPSLAQSLPTVVQGNITSTGALAAGSIASGFGAISTGNNITTTAGLQGNTIVATTTGNIGSTLTVGTPSTTTGTISLANSASSRQVLLQAPSVTGAGNATIQFPTVAGGSTDTVCLYTLANCTGVGGGITGGGTLGHIAKFSGTGSITDSALTEAGSTLTYDGNAVINAGSGFTGNLIDLQLDGVSQVSIDEAGNVIALGTINGATISGGTLSGGTVSGGTLTSSAVNGLSVNAGVISNPTISGTITGSGTPVITSFGTYNGQTISSTANFTGTLTVQGSTLTVGTPGATTGSINLANSTSSRQVVFQALNPSGTGDATVQIPSIAGGATDTVCLVALGNCAGSGGGITGSGTNGTIAKFTGAGTIADSILTESGTMVTATGTLNATTAFTLSGANINTAGTLNNVAYLNQANNFSAANTFSAAGTALSVTNNASIGGNLTVSSFGTGLVQSNGSGLLSSGAVDRNSSSYFNTALSCC